jgi:hypothetical protein
MLGGCGADATRCLSGTVVTTAFAVAPTAVQVELYRVFPGSFPQPLAAAPVDTTGKWAFGTLSAWTHYYVRVAAVFGSQGSISRVVGPLSIPSSGVPIAIDLMPVELQLLESRGVGAPSQVNWAEARIFDPATGVEILDGGASVTIAIGDASVPMIWNAGADAAAAYVFAPSVAPIAQPSYPVTVSLPATGSTPTQWQLVADAPTFDGVITSLSSAGSTIHVPVDAAGSVPVQRNTDLTVTFSAEPGADYVEVGLYEQADASWPRTYFSPSPESPETTQELVPAASLPDPAAYLLNVVYTKATCGLLASGCVHSAAVTALSLHTLDDAGTADATAD